MSYNIVLLLASIFLAAACSKNSVLSEKYVDSIIIGQAFGECGGECFVAFKIENGLVYRSSNLMSVAQVNAISDYEFARDPLPNIRETLIDSLVSNVPKTLDKFDTESFGCPDCGDWGMLPLVVDRVGQSPKLYILDNATRNMDEALRPYGLLMQTAVQEFR